MQISRRNNHQRENRQNNYEYRSRRRQNDQFANNLLAGVRGFARNTVRNPFQIGANQRVRRNQDHHQEVPEDMGYEDLLDLENRIGQVSKGYPSYVINSIPI
jgi:hypothetical protein